MYTEYAVSSAIRNIRLDGSSSPDGEIEVSAGGWKLELGHSPVKSMVCSPSTHPMSFKSRSPNCGPDGALSLMASPFLNQN